MKKKIRIRSCFFHTIFRFARMFSMSFLSLSISPFTRSILHEAISRSRCNNFYLERTNPNSSTPHKTNKKENRLV